MARRRLFLSTPNYASSLNHWPYHVREYTPRQLERLLAPFGRITVLGGCEAGEQRERIESRGLYYLLCDLYCYRGTHWLAKALKRVLFSRVWPHQALVVELAPELAMPRAAAGGTATVQSTDSTSVSGQPNASATPG